jgi:hypothetical protein
MIRASLRLLVAILFLAPALAFGQINPFPGGPPGGSPPVPGQPPGGSPPIPPDANERPQWEYVKDNRKVGTFTTAQMRQFLVNGTIGAETLVWRPGMANWTRAREVAEFRDIAGRGTGTGESSETGLRDRHRAFLAGTWRVQTQRTNVYGTVLFDITITYGPEGRYYGVETQSYSGNVVRQPRNGTWVVTPINETSFALTLTEDGGFSSTSELRVVDRNTLHNVSLRANVQRVN